MCSGDALWRISSAVSVICSLNRATVIASSARLCSDSRLSSSTDRVMAGPPSNSCWSSKTNVGEIELFLKTADESLDTCQHRLLIACEGPVIVAVELDESRRRDMAGE